MYNCTYHDQQTGGKGFGSIGHGRIGKRRLFYLTVNPCWVVVVVIVVLVLIHMIVILVSDICGGCGCSIVVCVLFLLLLPPRAPEGG